MKRKLLTILIFITMAIPMAGANAAEVTTTDLIEHASEWDGKTVTFTGELIGDVMLRGDHVWLNVLDDSNAIGIWAERSVLDSITSIGRYEQTGDTMQIKGVFHRACQEHGGDMDLHAEQIIVIKAGYQTEPVLSYPLLIGAVVLLLADGIVLAFIAQRKRSGK